MRVSVYTGTLILFKFYAIHLHYYRRLPPPPPRPPPLNPPLPERDPLVVAGLADDEFEDRVGCAEGDAEGRDGEDPIDCFVDGAADVRLLVEVDPRDGLVEGDADCRVDAEDPFVWLVEALFEP